MTRTWTAVLGVALLPWLGSCTCEHPYQSAEGAKAERKGSKKPKKKVPRHPLVVSRKPKKFQGQGLKFTEGPATDRTGNVFFADYSNDRVMKIDHETGDLSVHVEELGGPMGLMFDGEDRLYIAEEKARRVVRFEADETVSVLASRWNGKRLNGPVDIAVDSSGGVYFTDPWFDVFKRDDAEQEIDDEGIYYVDAEGKVGQVSADLIRPVGVILSTDEKTLFVSDYDDATVVAYPVKDDHTLGKPREVANSIGRANGLAVDLAGRIYVAANGGVFTFQPDGKKVGQLAMGTRPRNVTFGGPDRDHLYVAGGKAIYRWQMESTGATPLLPELMERLEKQKAGDEQDETGTDGPGEEGVGKRKEGKRDAKAGKPGKTNGEASADAKPKKRGTKPKKGKTDGDDDNR